MLGRILQSGIATWILFTGLTWIVFMLTFTYNQDKTLMSCINVKNVVDFFVESSNFSTFLLRFF